MSNERFHFVGLKRPYRFATPVPGEEFAAWIVAEDSTLSRVELNGLADELVASGCRYAVCSGHDCSRWDDAIDCACVARKRDGDSAEEDFVMTTWHPRESIEDAAEFFVTHTKFDGFEPHHYVVVAIGGGPQALAASALTRTLIENRMMS